MTRMGLSKQEQESLSELKAIRADEREECAKIADACAKAMEVVGMGKPEDSPERDRLFARSRQAAQIAAAIRARG